MISIVVIDDGIWTDETEVMSKVDSLYEISDNGQIYLCEKKIYPEDTHGGTCAYIIHDIYSTVRFVSLQILNRQGKCCGKKLKSALKWCTKHDCDIIHMSLATRSYYDYLFIKDVIYELLEQNKFLVSAIDNSSVVSYPAFFKKVFAVFMDNKDILANKQYGLFYAKNMQFYTIGVNYCKRKRNATGTLKKLDFANSYAAAALTGYLAKFIALNGNKRTPDLRKAFFREIYNKGGRVEGEFPKLYTANRNRSIPVLGIIQDGGKLSKEAVNFYRKHGYCVAAFAESHIENHIPLCFYFDSLIAIDEIFLLNMEDIYHPDLIIFQVDSANIVKTKEVEVFIKIEEHHIEVWIGESKSHFEHKEEAFYYSMDILMGNER